MVISNNGANAGLMNEGDLNIELMFKCFIQRLVRVYRLYYTSAHGLAVHRFSSNVVIKLKITIFRCTIIIMQTVLKLYFILYGLGKRLRQQRTLVCVFYICET